MTERQAFRFAAGDRLAVVEELAPRFFSEILDLDYDECLTTDESALEDYAAAGADLRADVDALLCGHAR